MCKYYFNLYHCPSSFSIFIIVVAICEPLTWKIDNRFQFSGQFKFVYEGFVSTCYVNDIRDLHLMQKLKTDDLVDVEGVLTTRLGSTSSKYKYFIRNVKPSRIRSSLLSKYYPGSAKVDAITYRFLKKAIEDYALLACNQFIKEGLPSLENLKNEFERYHVHVLQMEQPFKNVAYNIKVPPTTTKTVTSKQTKEALEKEEVFSCDQEFIKFIEEEHKRREGL